MKKELRELLKKCWDSGRRYGANMSSNNFNDFLNSLDSPQEKTPKVGNNEKAKEVCHNCGCEDKEYDKIAKEWFCIFCDNIWQTG